jgi:hypothetical protein
MSTLFPKKELFNLIVTTTLLPKLPTSCNILAALAEPALPESNLKVFSVR